MERIMTVEEKIRRAEEIYQRRRQGETKPVATVNVRKKKDIKLLKKMILQILICSLIYLGIYLIQNNQYVFSEDFLKKANEILSYDTNFYELYEKSKNQILKLTQKQDGGYTEQSGIGGGAEEHNIQAEQDNTVQENSTEQVSEENNTILEQTVIEQPQPQQLSQAEQDIINVKDATTFIKPVEGTITSKYGYRETATGNVPKDHTGTDIAAVTGTKIKSATDGEVVLASEQGDYRKTFENSNRRS